MQTHAPLAALLALAAAASADIFGVENAVVTSLSRTREAKSLGAVAGPATPAGCLYEGRWVVEGAAVATREACLRCRCGRGALVCARRACAAPPDPPPRRCHLLHRRGACCPELHCPDGVTMLEHSAAARLDELAAPASAGHVCVEDGAVYAAGSALAARAACEQCFCLRGRRRCVRPRCLPPPPGCRARPAPPACCPQRYYCDRPADAADSADTTPPHNHTNLHDCEVEGSHVPEGERAAAAEREPCTQCFCLRGRVRCQPLACAPPLLGCEPLLRPGHCCPHQYRCNRTQVVDPLSHHVSPILHNALISTRNEDRSLDTSRSNKYETTTKTLYTNAASNTSTISESSTKEQYVSTSKVKRKTSDSPSTAATHKPKQNATAANTKSASKATAKTTTKPVHKQTTKSTPTTRAITTTTTTPTTTTSTTTEAPTTTSAVVSSTSLTTSTEQPDGTVRIMINGTINCTAELSHSPLNTTANETGQGQREALPQGPVTVGGGAETQSSGSVDIITERNVNGGFEENETFTINVTSSLRTNQSHTTAPSRAATVEAINISKKNKEDYDYDYAEPTLPPSLPNLKIIPFVAADAVVDEDADKAAVAYPALEREDKFPVYYPSKESQAPFATRREDVFPPHPVFFKEQYPPLSHAAAAPAPAYAHAHNDLPSSLHEVIASAALESRVSESRKSTKAPSPSTKPGLETPAVNLFSPPAETEGGFIPKGPGIIDEYYAVYPSTPVPPSLPHLTTSMQLDTGKGDCFSSDGRLVPEGESIALACSVCACAWGELHCSPRACAAPPPGCHRRPAAPGDADLCCGHLVCHQENKLTTISAELSTRRTEITLNVTKVPVEIPSDVIPFDPPPDRREPATDRAVTNKEMQTTNTETTTSKTVVVTNVTGSKNNETFKQETTTSSTTPYVITEKSTAALGNFTTTQHFTDSAEVNETSDQSQEYEDEEEDEGFSFGSVLKLLLSDSYESSTVPPLPKKTPPATTAASTTTTTAAPKLHSTTRKKLPKPTVPPFVPLPNHYVPPKKVYQPNTINRIDHLVLGEATAIRKPTPRPVSAASRPVTATFKPYTRPNSPRPITTTTTRPVVTKKEETKSPSTSVSYEVVRPPVTTAASAPAAGAGVGGLLKLAGCNIYGQMYRVGRIIAELSTPCQECRCTELGVSCRPLAC